MKAMLTFWRRDLYPALRMDPTWQAWLCARCKEALQAYIGDRGALPQGSVHTVMPDGKKVQDDGLQSVMPPPAAKAHGQGDVADHAMDT
jgi:hypothetical protein